MTSERVQHHPQPHRRRPRPPGPRTAAVLLLGGTLAAIVWANVPGGSYEALWQTQLHVGVGSADSVFTLRDVVNNGLMTIFFFAVGLDVRREFAIGELTTWSKAVIPTVAAVAGLTVPALIFVAFNLQSGYLHAWAAVISTDTAFLLGALALAGSRVPNRLRVFLLALSVVDDIGALSVIAVAYTDDFRAVPLLIAAATLAATWFARSLPMIWRRPTYAVLWVATWVALLASGIEPTLAGVAIALVMPVAKPDVAQAQKAAQLADDFSTTPTAGAELMVERTARQSISINERLQLAVTPWTSYVILPLFAIANAGLVITPSIVESALTSPLTWGIVVGLAVGKFVGVFGSTALLKALHIGDFGARLDYRRLAGASALCGIGFTISLYVIGIAIADPTAQNEARFGVLIAGIVAMSVGLLIFRTTEPADDARESSPATSP